MRIVQAERGKAICLGRKGENLARQVVFDIYEWQEMYGEGVARLVAQRMGDDAPYPCVIEMDGNHVIWTITSADTARPGRYGKCELSYCVGDTLVKSATYQTLVGDAMVEASEEPPEPYQDWVEQVLAAGEEAENAAGAAAASAAAAQEAQARMPVIRGGNWWVWDSASEQYVDTGYTSTGPKGDVPVRGEDYWTENDKQEIVSGAAELVNEKYLPEAVQGLASEEFVEKAIQEIGAIEIFPETELDYDAGLEVFGLTVELELIVGDTYIVTWNGKDYECVAYAIDSDGYEYITLGGDSYPFFIEAIGDAYSNEGLTEATLRIAHVDKVVTKTELEQAINRLPTETWTFTLDDGTVIEKKVVVAE